MDSRVLSILRCPECKGELAAGGAEAAHNAESTVSQTLSCSNGHSFPVLRGILRFVPNEEYVSSFGFEWNRFSSTQLDHAEAVKEEAISKDAEGQVQYQTFSTRKGRESYDTFYHKTGFTEEELEGKRVLDAGCGTGRFADVASAAGAEVFACDLSLAVEACQRNFGQRDNIHVLQADIFKLPFAPGSFDLIYSLGVLHHTPDTREAFLSLVPLLKPGGKIVIWVYDKQEWSGLLPPYYLVSDFLRRWTSQWEAERLLRFCRVRARLHRLTRIPLLGIFFERLWPGSVHPEYEWRVLDTFDWYSPKYQWKHTREEVEGWFREVGLTEIKPLPFLVSVSGIKPEEGNVMRDA